MIPATVRGLPLVWGAEMARIRTIKPEFWTSEQIVECSPIARLLFIGIWNFCDDGGNHPASDKTLKMEVLPGDDLTIQKVKACVGELIDQGLIDPYIGEDGRQYWHVTGWHHQRIDRPSFKHPPYVRQVLDDPSPNTRLNLDEQSPPEGNGKEGSREKGSRKSMTPGPSDPSIRDERTTTRGVGNRKGRFNPLAYLLAAGVSESTARDWLDLRKQKRATPTKTALEGIQAEATKAGLAMEDALRIACANGWQGFRADWLERQGRALTRNDERARTIACLTGRNRASDQVTGDAIATEFTVLSTEPMNDAE